MVGEGSTLNLISTSSWRNNVFSLRTEKQKEKRKLCSFKLQQFLYVHFICIFAANHITYILVCTYATYFCLWNYLCAILFLSTKWSYCVFLPMSVLSSICLPLHSLTFQLQRETWLYQDKPCAFQQIKILCKWSFCLWIVYRVLNLHKWLFVSLKSFYL